MRAKGSISQLEISNSAHAKADGITVTKAYRRKVLINHIIGYIAYAIIIAVIAFLGFLTVKGPVLTTNGYVYPINEPAQNGSKVIITPQEDNFGGRLSNGLLKSDTVIGKVVVGNYGTLTATGDVYTVTQDGKVYVTKAKIQEKHGKYLNNEYVVKITQGKNAGKQVIVKGSFVRTLKK